MCMFVEERECVRMPTIALLLNMKHHPLFPPHAQPGNDRRRKRRSYVREAEVEVEVEALQTWFSK